MASKRLLSRPYKKWEVFCVFANASLSKFCLVVVNLHSEGIILKFLVGAFYFLGRPSLYKMDDLGCARMLSLLKLFPYRLFVKTRS